MERLTVDNLINVKCKRQNGVISSSAFEAMANRDSIRCSFSESGSFPRPSNPLANADPLIFCRT